MLLNIHNEEVFNRIIDAYSPMVYRIAYQNVFNKYDSEDIMQDVFVKLISKKAFYADEEHLKAWLIRVTVNLCINYKKSQTRQSMVPFDALSFEFTEAEKNVLEELYLLEQEDRTILYLYYYEGYRIREIANILHQKQNTINSKLTRARKKLKTIMEAQNE